MRAQVLMNDQSNEAPIRTLTRPPHRWVTRPEFVQRGAFTDDVPAKSDDAGESDTRDR
jgi:hypothetical protein